MINICVEASVAIFLMMLQENRRKEKGIGESSVAASGDASAGGGDVGLKPATELTTAERQEIPMKKAKLISMLDEGSCPSNHMELQSSNLAKQNMTNENIILKLPLEMVSSQFKLEEAICNHGFFMMAPNSWDPSIKTLCRPLRLSDSTNSINVSISQSPTEERVLILKIDNSDGRDLSTDDHKAILDQVKRMLRLSDRDEAIVNEFQNMHPKAKLRNFGRLFRSPSLFEDLIKTLLLCNCPWKRTLEMAESLCELEAELRSGRKGRQRADNIASSSIFRSVGNFPTPEDLSRVEIKTLKKFCNLGYREKYVLNLAKLVQGGKLKLERIEQNIEKETYQSLIQKFKKIKGFGPFVCSNALMCVGFYDQIPADSETIRHMKEVKGKNCNKKTLKYDLEEIYGSYGSFQCLAYWFELLEGYEKKLGKMCDLPTSKYYMATGGLREEHEANEL